MPDRPQVGVVNGLAVYGPNMGTLLEVEAAAGAGRPRAQGGSPSPGVMEEEEMGGPGMTMRRRSHGPGSVDNVLTVLRTHWA